jgi:hypothetical protein
VVATGTTREKKGTRVAAEGKGTGKVVAAAIRGR